MSKTLETITFSRAGEAVASLPRCSGVYRFYDAEGSLLYIGKSVDIHSRVTQHLNEGRKPGRHQRLMSQVSRIDCQLTGATFQSATAPTPASLDHHTAAVRSGLS